MNHRITRREFLVQSGVFGAGLWLSVRGGWAQGKSPNEKLNVGVIGSGGQGGSNLNNVASTENVVALCDIDERQLNEAAAKFPNAKKYTDWRKLLEQKDVDAVTVSTPDHVHACASIAAMKLGKGVYCEKPLTHSVYEARRMAQVAAEMKVATQMGNQGHSADHTRRCVELIQAGVIGAVREVHCWTDRPIWPQGVNRPPDTPPCPPHIHWDLWLGPAPERPYHPIYHPFRWRGWWDFGTGALGDMACHCMDVLFWSLRLGAPLTVEAECDAHYAETAPKWSIIRYEFPARGDLPPVKLTWYDGGKYPPAELAEGEKYPDNGTLFIGEKGKLLLMDPYGGSSKLLPAAQFKDFSPPAPYIPRSPGHHAEWIQGCKTGSPTGSNFQYAAALTEMVLLGNVALRVGKKIEWDAANMKAKNCPEADQYLRREYRKGWSL